MTDQEKFADLLGLTTEEAETKAKGRGITCIRVTRWNGQYGLATADYRFDRLNVWIENDKITHISGIG